ncbi:acyl-CoA Delta(11) desaturase-like [Cydia splendana]|uniref:acyl-CoA Delta(11) desaturase-like n=1 Tax=Cydia splendana TaxID=1100963 RepID=UPI0028F4A4CD
MAPNVKETEIYNEKIHKKQDDQTTPREYILVYPMIIVMAYWHIGAIYGLYLLCFNSMKWATLLLNFLIYAVTCWGIGAGTHRLFCHRAYKANYPLQVMLMLFHTFGCQSTVINWARDHRLHHKYTDTDADPYNPKRGFFYSHIGWLLVKKHPELIEKGKTLDLSDLYENPVLRFQQKYYAALSLSLAFILPSLIPLFWQETLNNSYHLTLFRIVIGSHFVFSINSVAHIFGNKPYDKAISPTTNVTLSVLTFGEGYHNYHHVFPYDYRTSEFGNNYLNFSTNFIDFCAWIGWAYDLKYVSDDVIENRAKKTGDGSDLWGRVRTKIKG